MNKIEQWMNSRIGLNFRSGLDRMEQAVSLLGRPDKAYPILHVTGTNGKGSTIAFMRQLLMAHGKRVGPGFGVGSAPSAAPLDQSE